MKYRHLIKSMEAGVISVSDGIKNRRCSLCAASNTYKNYIDRKHHVF